MDLRFIITFRPLCERIPKHVGSRIAAALVGDCTKEDAALALEETMPLLTGDRVDAGEAGFDEELDSLRSDFEKEARRYAKACAREWLIFLTDLETDVLHTVTQAKSSPLLKSSSTRASFEAGLDKLRARPFPASRRPPSLTKIIDSLKEKVACAAQGLDGSGRRRLSKFVERLAFTSFSAEQEPMRIFVQKSESFFKKA